MSDVDGTDIAEMVYTQLIATGEGGPPMEPESVAYALDEATRAMRAKRLPPERWVPFIHLGI